MHRKRTFIGLLFTSLCISLIFLGQIGYTGTEKRIGVILLTKEHDFFREMEEGLFSEANKYHYKVQILFAEYDHSKQVEMMNDFIAKKVDALILAPCDSKAIGDAIVKANEAKIPVFTVDIANLSGKGKVVAHIASDNFEGGKLAGRLMAEALNGKGKVVIINHPNITSCIDRVNGFREFLRAYPGIQIMADIPAWGQRYRAMSITEDLLLMMPDLKGIYAINDEEAIGASLAIQAAGMTRKIIIVGYDGTEEARQAINDGKIYGDIIQYPKEIARLAIKAISDYFHGKPVKSFIPVKVGVYTR